MKKQINYLKKKNRLCNVFPCILQFNTPFLEFKMIFTNIVTYIKYFEHYPEHFSSLHMRQTNNVCHFATGVKAHYTTKRSTSHSIFILSLSFGISKRLFEIHSVRFLEFLRYAHFA